MSAFELVLVALVMGVLIGLAGKALRKHEAARRKWREEHEAGASQRWANFIEKERLNEAFNKPAVEPDRSNYVRKETSS